MKNIITLSNGKRVGNFSSPHPFIFTDGSVLAAVSNEEAERLKITFTEEEINDKGDIKLSFSIPVEVMKELWVWLNYKNNDEIDVVFCPLPMIIALVDEFGEPWLIDSPFRAIRMEDRILKLVSIDKQCVNS